MTDQKFTKLNSSQDTQDSARFMTQPQQTSTTRLPQIASAGQEQRNENDQKNNTLSLFDSEETQTQYLSGKKKMRYQEILTSTSRGFKPNKIAVKEHRHRNIQTQHLTEQQNIYKKNQDKLTADFVNSSIQTTVAQPLSQKLRQPTIYKI